jgi:hypothetical protein
MYSKGPKAICTGGKKHYKYVPLQRGNPTYSVSLTEEMIQANPNSFSDQQIV